MLWRKQRSPSPPRLTSTIPEMEQHLAAMDVDIPFATTSENIPAATNSAQEQTDTQAAGSDSKGVSTTVELQGTTLKDDTKTSANLHTKIDNPKSKTICVKALRSRPRLLTLIACVSYLLFHLMGINIGLRTIQGYTEPRLQRAEIHLTNTAEALAIDYLLNIQLSNLLDTTLDPRYMESNYESCLARGLHKANHVFRGFDFTSNPHIRNQTVDWVTCNCRRLLFTPQVHNLRASKLRARTNDIRQAAGKVLRLLKHKLALLQRRLQGGSLRLTAKPFVMEPANYTANHSRVLPDMPYGFGLNCEEQSRCRLVYSEPTTPNKYRKTLKAAADDARKEVDKWSWDFQKIYRVIDCMITSLAILQPLLVNFYLLATMITLRRPEPLTKLSFTGRHTRAWSRICDTIAHLQHAERHTLGLIINTALYALLSFQLKYIIAEFDRILLPVGLGFCVFHSVQALAFFDPEVSADETMRTLFRAVQELHLIAQGVGDLPEAISKTQPSSSPKKPTASPPARPSSKIAARFISPLTPISEDLQQERRAMHAEQGNQPRVDVEPQYGSATETDSDYDSDVQHSSYVDLTGGATPFVAEDEDELVVVED